MKYRILTLRQNVEQNFFMNCFLPNTNGLKNSFFDL